nr:unnamed protein product [Callosobruchus analis]
MYLTKLKHQPMYFYNYFQRVLLS